MVVIYRQTMLSKCMGIYRPYRGFIATMTGAVKRSLCGTAVPNCRTESVGVSLMLLLSLNN